MSTPSSGHQDPLLAARQVLAQFLSLAFTEPRLPRFECLLAPGVLELASAAATLLREALPESIPPLGLGDGHPDGLRPEVLEPYLTDREGLVEAHQAVFGLLLSKDCPPYETEFCRQRSPVFRSQVMADVAGFYLAFGLEPAPRDSDRVDHLTLELEFLSWVATKEGRAQAAMDRLGIQVCREARGRFLREHVLSWMPAFAKVLRLRVARLGGAVASYYEELGRLLAAWLTCERLLSGLPVRHELPEPSASEAEVIPPGCGGAGDSRQVPV